jgi:cytochrome P450
MQLFLSLFSDYGIPWICPAQLTGTNSVLTKPEHIKIVFKDSDKHHKAVNNNSGYLMSQVLGKCVGLVSGQEWKHLRAVSGTAFARSNISSHVALIEERVARYLGHCEENGRLRDGLIDPVEDLKMLPFLTVADVIYGKLSLGMEQTLRDLAPVHEKLFRHVIQGGLSRFGFSRFLPIEAQRTLRKFDAKWRAFNHAAYQRASERSLTETPIAQLFDALEKGTVSAEHVHHTLDEALYANLDVTMGGLSWNLVFLASDQEVQNRLRQEIQQVRQEEKNMHRYLLSSTSFLAACISESSRLKPLAAFSVPQSAPTERVLDGYRIPAGTHFVVDTYALNIRNEFWGADAQEYRPSRFQTVDSTDARYNFWRFGFGPRQCMGRYVADVIVRATLVALVDRWELHLPKELADQKQWGRDRETWITHPQMELICMPVGRS